MSNVEWQELGKQIHACQKCKLAKSKKILGEGSISSDIVLVGESPGEQEEKTGKLFVGKSGELLTDILTIVGISRKDIYITNIVKCHPPNNEVTTDSALSCQSWLFKELEIIKPKIIIPLGAFATSFFIKDMSKISDVRGKWIQCGDYKVIPTFHPAYVLHGGGPMAKDHIISDFLKVRSELMGINDKVKAIKIKSKLLNDTILVGEGGVSLSELWSNLKQQ